MKVTRKISWIVFFVSFIILNYLILTGKFSFVIGRQPQIDNPQTILAVASLITSVTSLLVAITTTILTNRRDSVEIKKSELEAEKTKLEIQEIKRKAAKAGGENVEEKTSADLQNKNDFE